MRPDPQITVYIPCRNYGSYLKESVDSVFRQNYKDWELLIIDDGSTDNTPDIIKLYEGIPNVRAYRTEGIKLPGVCNLAIREAKGKYIIRLDGDDVFDENILLVLATFLNSNPKYAMVFPDYYLMDQVGNIFSHERRRKLYEEDHILDLPPNGACILAKTEVLRAIGGYREDLGAQDGFDLWVKVREKYKCGNVNLPLFYYRRHYHNMTGASGDSSVIKNARRKIKKDASQNAIGKYRPIIGIVPIRKHFDFIEDLWKQKLGDHTMLDYTLMRLQSSSVFDKILVASDNDDARIYIEDNYTDSRIQFCTRSFESTYRTAPLSQLLEEIIEPFDPEFKGISVINFIQAPFLTRDSIEEAVYTLLMADADATISVEEYHDQNFYVRGEYGLQKLNLHQFQYLDGRKIYRDANVCTALKNINIKKGNMRGPRLGSYSITGAESFFISDEYNFDIAQLIAGNFHHE
ncbi:MAG: glycosyltransferase [Alphaproteobacteria bacterium]|nr:glycosyltransferase [Alphaproteobacteria bacterium]